jgi:hypothetical protein
MLYRWVRRLESMQMPATSFPAAGGDPAVETQESQHLDGALIAATIASLWVWVRSAVSLSPASLDWFVLTYGLIFLVVLFGALLVRPEASSRSTAAHLAAYAGLALVIGVFWATSPIQVIVWAAFFGLVGVVTAVLCVVVWAAALLKLSAAQAKPQNNASDFRLICGLVILGAALIGALGAVTVPPAGL